MQIPSLFRNFFKKKTIFNHKKGLKIILNPKIKKNKNKKQKIPINKKNMKIESLPKKMKNKQTSNLQIFNQRQVHLKNERNLLLKGLGWQWKQLWEWCCVEMGVCSGSLNPFLKKKRERKRSCEMLEIVNLGLAKWGHELHSKLQQCITTVALTSWKMMMMIKHRVYGFF